MRHLCHAIGCDTDVPRARLMCKDHWLMIDRNIRKELHRLKEAEVDVADGSGEYLVLAGEAIASVRQRERQELSLQRG